MHEPSCSRASCNDLPQSLNEFWRIVKPGAHFKLRNAQPVRLCARLMIDFSQRLHVIGDKRHRHDAHLANLFRGQAACKV